MKQLHFISYRAPLFLLLPLFLLQSLNGAEARKPTAIGALFYSDSCGSCKVLDPKITAARANTAEAAVLFITFDHSNDASRNQAALLADQVGLKKIYEEQSKASGFLLLIDTKSGSVLEKVTKTATVDEIEALIEDASAG